MNRAWVRERLLSGLRPLFRAQQNLLKRSAILRRAAYEGLPPEALVIANSPDGPFVCCAQDRIIGAFIYAYGMFELHKALKALKIMGRPSNSITFVDVGANIGPICLPLLKRGLVARAVAIEPDPLNFRLLQANIILNGLTDSVRAIQCAAGSEDDQSLLFELSNNNFGDHRIRADALAGGGQAGRNVIEVRGFRLDTILQDENTDKVVLWIDAQGYEGFILAGAKRLRTAKVPIVCEFCPFFLRKSGSFACLKDAIIGSGYARLFDLNQRHPVEETISAAKFDDLFEKYDRGPDCFADILFI